MERKPLSYSLVLLVASVVCFAIATLSAVGVIQSAPVDWAYGGALAYVLSVLIP